MPGIRCTGMGRPSLGPSKISLPGQWDPSAGWPTTPTRPRHSSVIAACPRRELALFTHFMGVRPAPSMLFCSWASSAAAPPRTINGACEDFICSLQDAAPSTASTVLRSASKLRAFDFNDPAAQAPPAVDVGFAHRGRGQPDSVLGQVREGFDRAEMP